MVPAPSTIMPSYGNRLLPEALDKLALLLPDRLYASIPQGRDLSDGFTDISCGDMARCVNFMAQWIENRLGVSSDFETIVYIGIPDLRSAAIFLGAVKCGYKMLLPSPRNPPATNVSLMQQTSCSAVLHAIEVLPVIKALKAASPGFTYLEIPSFDEMLKSNPEPYPFTKIFEDAKDEPIVVLHSSGSTGVPKPITMTHASFAVLDNERNLPKVAGRRNRDYSVWDFNDGGRFYTVFPYFHLAGFLSLVVNPIFTESSSPVLGPPLMPPSGSLLKDVMRQQPLRALYLPPSIAEQLLMEPGGREFFKSLDFLCYTGGPFSPSAGEMLSAVTELCPLYGSTEAFQVPQLAPSPEDWAWMEWNPHFKVEMQPSTDESDAFELVLFADESTKEMSALNHNLPGVSEYRTKDLFKQHPRKNGLWQYYGRRDDIIVLSNGEKFNPVPMELKIQGHLSLAGALVVGQGRTRAMLLLEPKPDVSGDRRAGLTEEVWPLVEEANKLLPAQGRILRGHVLVAEHNKPFTRAGKGTIVRRLTEKLYIQEIDALYLGTSGAPTRKFIRLQPATNAHFEMDTILSFVRSILASSFKDLADINDEDDLFSCGLDSVMIGQLLSNLKEGLKESSTAKDLNWLDTRLVFQNSSVERLSTVLSHFLNSGQPPSVSSLHSRMAAMNDLVTKYTHGLTGPTICKERQSCRSVALVGSTGYLGPQILASLLRDPGIATVHCLNRGTDALERTKAALHGNGLIDPVVLERVKFTLIDLGAANLGLAEADFINLSNEVDVIVYNSWRPNFALPLSAFEKPFLSGLRTIIDWARTSPMNPRIVFVSSIAAVGNCSRVNPKEAKIPEAPISDANVAMHMGYGESKNVAECILQSAHLVCSVPIDIVRTGQIGGPSTPTGPTWPDQGWLLAIIRTSKAMNIMPTHLSPIDWVPVDILAKQISAVVKHSSDTEGYRVFNLVHPKVHHWDLLLDTLSERFDMNLERITLQAWLDRLEEKAAENPEKWRKLGALKLFDFLRSLGNGMEDMRCVSGNIGRVANDEMASLTQELLGMWLDAWDF